MAALRASTISGLNGMPAGGQCFGCSAAGLRSAHHVHGRTERRRTDAVPSHTVSRPRRGDARRWRSARLSTVAQPRAAFAAARAMRRDDCCGGTGPASRTPIPRRAGRRPAEDELAVAHCDAKARSARSVQVIRSSRSCRRAGTLVTLDRWAGLVSHDAAHASRGDQGGHAPGRSGSGTRRRRAGDAEPSGHQQAVARRRPRHGHAWHRDGGFTALHGQVERAAAGDRADGEIVDCDADRDGANSSMPRASGSARSASSRKSSCRIGRSTRMRKRTYVAPFDEAVEQWPQLVAQHRNVEFYAVPFTGLAAVITATRPRIRCSPAALISDTADADGPQEAARSVRLLEWRCVEGSRSP